MTEIIPGFASAQAAYDRQEPPEYEECRVCEDAGELEIACLTDLDGNPREVPESYHHSAPCPWCPTEPMR